MELLRKKNFLWQVLIAETIAITVISFFIAARSDSFHYDDYALMKNVSKPFWDYATATYSWSYFPTTVHYWLSYRLFGHDIISYRIFPLVSYCLILVILFWGVLKTWKSSSLLFFLLIALSANRYLLYHVGYSVITFANDMLLGCSMYFIFLSDTQNPLTEKQWVVLTIILMPFVFFSNVIIILPVCSGILTSAIFRYWQSGKVRTDFSVPHAIWTMKPVFLIPVMHLVISTIFVNQNLGIEKRPDMAQLFFPSSQFSRDAGGFFQFVSSNLYTLAGGLLAPKIPSQILPGLSPFTGLVFIILLALIVAASLIYGTFKNQENNCLIFTELFCAITLFGMILGSYFGAYPFGDPRYAGYLLVPLLILPAYVFSLWFDRFLNRFSDYQNFILISSIILIGIGGSFFNYHNFVSNKSIQDENQRALEEINASSVDLILFSSYIEPVFSQKCPEKFSESLSMGWGSFYAHGSDGGIDSLMQDRFSGSDSSQKTDQILVIASDKKVFTTEYPSWNYHLNKDFRLTWEKQFPSLWLAYYKRENKNPVRSIDGKYV